MRHDGVVPVSVVVQLVSPAVSATLAVGTGATATTSGATSVDDPRASASPTVSVDAEPNPPRTPVLSVELPGETTRRFVPELVDLVLDVGLGRPGRARR